MKMIILTNKEYKKLKKKNEELKQSLNALIMFIGDWAEDENNHKNDEYYFKKITDFLNEKNLW